MIDDSWRYAIKAWLDTCGGIEQVLYKAKIKWFFYKVKNESFMKQLLQKLLHSVLLVLKNLVWCKNDCSKWDFRYPVFENMAIIPKSYEFMVDH